SLQSRLSSPYPDDKTGNFLIFNFMDLGFAGSVYTVPLSYGISLPLFPGINQTIPCPQYIP
ncbi:MAG: hypothetical protein MUF15_28240, partial [Acidobacteria bacterium]|nr:hypothetical protein [Acidobacteriota bacterium]